MTVLLISHDLEQVERLADRVGFLIDGRVEQIGAPSELLSAHFGQAHEWHVQLERVPDAAGLALLSELALQPDPAGGQLHWCGWLEDVQHAGAQLQRLEHGRIAIREWRVRQPGLDSLWRKVFGAAEPEQDEDALPEEPTT